MSRVKHPWGLWCDFTGSLYVFKQKSPEAKHVESIARLVGMYPTRKEAWQQAVRREEGHLKISFDRLQQYRRNLHKAQRGKK